jgi:Mrp family chromosome partitioning ATPase
VEAYLRTTQVANLRLLPSGPLPPNPAELLGSQRMKNLVQELKQQADVILFDSPPVLAVTDAAVLSTYVDGVLVVFDAGQTRREIARKSVQELHRVGANLLGVVMNRLSRAGGGYYYYYYYYRSEDRKGRKRRPHRRRGLRRLIPFGRILFDGAGKKEALVEEPVGAMDLGLPRGDGNTDNGGRRLDAESP